MANERPHVVLVPLMAQGHMIPMLDIAHLLVDRGATVTYITTPSNAARIQSTIDRTAAAGLPIHFTILDFPSSQVGLPQGCENVDQIPLFDEHAFINFLDATFLLKLPLQLYLRKMDPKPSCMIVDYALPWTMDVARSLNILRFVFHGPSCFFILCVHRINVHHPYDGLGWFDPVALPNMPCEVRVTQAQAPGWFPTPDMAHICNKAIEAETSADGIVVNTCFELEKDMVDCYEKSIGKPVWPIGPLSVYNKDITEARGKKSSVDEQKVLGWMSSLEPMSVMYLNFGSMVVWSPEQLIEIGRGLEASGRPFIWVIKEAEECPEGFEEMTKGKGLVIKGWAPQMAILSHPSVGGFLTHCGWNSILEAVSAKVPMVTWPCFSDQLLNETLVIDVLGIGVGVGVEMPFNIERLVKGEDVAKAIGRLMDGGEEGEGVRLRIAKLGERARKAMEEGGSSYNNSKLMMEYIRESSK